MSGVEPAMPAGVLSQSSSSVFVWLVALLVLLRVGAIVLVFVCRFPISMEHA
jgi:hypothetical protein